MDNVNKKGQLSSSKIKGVAIGGILTFIISLIIILNVLSGTIGSVSDSGESIENINETFDIGENGTVVNGTLLNLPFASLFGSGGLVVLAFMVVVLLGILASMGLLGSSKR